MGRRARAQHRNVASAGDKEAVRASHGMECRDM